MTIEDREPAPTATTGEPGSRSSHATDEKKKQKKHLPLWQETVLLLAIALGLAIVIKALLVQAFYIPSESMEPGLVKNDRILVQKVSYWFGGEPERGDVVVFKDPGGWLSAVEAAGPTSPVAKLMAKVGLYPEGGHLVKRVVGVEGDVISCCDKQGRIEVDGEPVEEDAFARPGTEGCFGPMTGSCDWTTAPVPEGHVFVMGDNRRHSADSTVHMCTTDETDCVPGDEFVPVDLVVGKVFVLLWPADRFGFVHRPDAYADATDSR